MKLICSGLNVDINKIKDIKNRNYFNKPEGGLWTCPLRENEEYKSAWLEWCEGENFSTHDNSNYTTLEIEDDCRLLILSTGEDVKRLEKRYLLINDDPSWSMKYLDFENLAEDYDAILLTEKGECENRYTLEGISLYGWDVETVLILNKECIIENSIKYFESCLV